MVMLCARSFAAVRLLAVWMLVVWCGAAILSGAEEPAPHPVTAELIADTAVMVPGRPFQAGLWLRMEPGWHTYSEDPGDAGMATSLDWELPDGFSVGPIQWPPALVKIEPGNLRVNVYEGEVLLPVTVTPPARLDTARVRLRAVARWLVCKEACLPGRAELELDLPVGTAPQPAHEALFAKYRVPPAGMAAPGASDGSGAAAALRAGAPAVHGPTLPLASALWLAFLGGLILNVMPCVLPVISLKILGFVEQGREQPARVRLLGLVYSAGVLASFAALAVLAVVVQKAGGLASWGMQFQDPRALVVITTVVLLVALNLFGVFEIALGGRALNAAAGLAGRAGFAGAFFHGMLTVVLATACTAPFLGAALGFAVFQPAHIIFLMFLAIGTGLALPYTVLSFFPALLRFLPRPGAWMERFKVAMGFPMLATVVWLVDVAFGFYGGKVFWLGLFFVMLALAAWVYGEFGQRSRAHPVAGTVAAVLLAVAGWGWALEHELDWRNPPAPERPSVRGEGGIPWQPWSVAAVEAARQAGRPVVVEFTADWCVTCKANERTSIEIPAVRAKIAAIGAVPLRGDFTRGDPAIAAELRRHGRAGVPLVLVYPRASGAAPLVLPELLTPASVLEALEKAAR